MTRLANLSRCLAAGPLVLAACRGEEQPAPPPMRYGESICDQCGMAISDERYAAAMLVRTQDGEVIALRFDDIGCLADYEREQHPLDARGRYVHDHGTRAWLDAESALYLRAPTLRTPMASGLAAFADRAEAERAAGQWPGEIVGYASITDRAAVPPPDLGERAPRR